jgi:PAS domain S-box-containing protein
MLGGGLIKSMDPKANQDLFEVFDAIPMGVLITSTREPSYFNKTLAEILGIDISARGDALRSKSLLGSFLDQIRHREFIQEQNRLYKVIRFEQFDHMLFLLIEISSLEYLNQFFLSVDFAEEILKFVFLNPYEGMNVVDREGRILYMSPTHEKFLGIEHGKAIGNHATEIIENTRLHIVAKTGKAEIGKTQEMKGQERIVARIPIRKDGQVVGAIGKVMFRDLYQLRDITGKLESLTNEVDYYKRELTSLRQSTYSLDRIIGVCPRIEQMKEEIRKAAQVDLPVLIVGETGTGKELVAHTVHNLSNRGKNPMITVNISAIPPELFESELFGYEPGSFTDASRKGKPGKFELAHGNSIFLDEIGDLPPEVQSKLLRVLQGGYVEKIGAKKLVKSDFRVVSATNKDIDALLDDNRFRLDLFYRINAVTIHVPPLRERIEDIPVLAEHFIVDFNRKYHQNIRALSDEVMERFNSYHWPGNVRELENEIGRACSFSSSPVLGLDDFSRRIKTLRKKGGGARLQNRMSRKEVLELAEKDLVMEALARANGNKARAAKILGLSRTMLYKKIKRLNIAA